MKINPILMYGYEFFVIFPMNAIELVQRHACKSFLCVNQRAMHEAVIAEWERYPICIEMQIL